VVCAVIAPPSHYPNCTGPDGTPVGTAP
jgi:hypothetical protein